MDLKRNRYGSPNCFNLLKTKTLESWIGLKIQRGFKIRIKYYK